MRASRQSFATSKNMNKTLTDLRAPVLDTSCGFTGQSVKRFSRTNNWSTEKNKKLNYDTQD